MSAPAVLYVNAHTAQLLLPSGALDTLPVPDDLDAFGRAVESRVRGAASAARELVVVIGGAWLDCAQPSLPALPVRDQRRALHFQADREFTLTPPLALTVSGVVAVAADAARLSALRTALGWIRLRAVVGLPEAMAAAGLSGTWRADATVTTPEQLVVTLAEGRVQDARRVRGDLAAVATAPVPASAAVRVLDVPALLRAVQTRGPGLWDETRQLLDVATEAQFARERRGAWVRAGVLCTAAVAFMAWAYAQRCERQLAATRAEIAEATRDAAPALAAAERLRRATAEHDAIAASAVTVARANNPVRVLARLGAVLPSGAFVQHLEWDGTSWRIDGSATDAAQLVPRLDADPEIERVQVLAPSTRFLDSGTPRSSFSIGFQVRPATARVGGTNGAP
jgi:hypothetical protein